MDKLILLFYLLLALSGCDQGKRIVNHEVVNGRDVIYSTIQISGRFATFRCLSSRSGECHYTVLAPACATQGTHCEPPITAFSVRAGEKLLLSSLPDDFATCASTGPATDGDCSRQLASTGKHSP